MSGYVPNVGEKEDLKAQLATNAIQLMLYKNFVIPDGNTITDTLTELIVQGGYAQKQLLPVVGEDALAANKWFLSLNSAGKAQAQYSNAVLQWIMDAANVASGETVQGVAGYCWVLPFDQGANPNLAGPEQLRIGQVIKGVSSGATGIITGIMVQSGTWANGDAAGYLNIMTKTGTFEDDENLTIIGCVATVSVANGGTGYAVGDIIKPIQTGGRNAKLVVATVNGGVVTSLLVVYGGDGYTVATPLTTAKVTGGGDNALTIGVATLAAAVYAVANTGTINGGDAHKRLLFVEPMTTPTLINTPGQPFNCTPILTCASG